MRMATRKILSLLFLLTGVHQLEAEFRSYNIQRSGSALGAGGTGIVATDSASNLVSNPAVAANFNEPRISTSFEALTRIQNFSADGDVAATKMPSLSMSFPLTSNTATGLLFSIPFERTYPEGNFSTYTTELLVSHTVNRHLNIGATGGLGIARQSNSFTAYSPSGSLSLAWSAENYSAGAFYRPGMKLQWNNFLEGASVEEQLPDQFHIGAARLQKWGMLALSAEYTNWRRVSFVENDSELAPDFETGFLDYITFHGGIQFHIPRWSGLLLRAGAMTDNYYDLYGKNDRQILFTAGLGGYAGSDFWGERLKLDFSIVSSYLSSFFWNESHQIEQLQAAFEFQY